MYKRYMVFLWDEYDNPDPFDCVSLTTDDIEKAKAEVNDSDSYGKAIFDRVIGKRV